MHPEINLGPLRNRAKNRLIYIELLETHVYFVGAFRYRLYIVKICEPAQVVLFLKQYPVDSTVVNLNTAEALLILTTPFLSI